MKRHIAALFVAAAAVVLTARPAVRAQAPPDARFDALASLAEAKMKEYGVPGVALGVIADGQPTIRGLGVTNVEDPLPVTAHTVFPIASISKTFAATAMMRLVEQGKVDLHAPVRTYIPDFRVRDESVSRDVTVWHLLTHLGGWEGQVSGPDRGTDTLRNFVATTMPDVMQVAPPGKAWSYNNAGFSVAGRVIETVTGKSINQAIRDLVFQPLGLEHAGTTAGDFIVQRFAAGHYSVNGHVDLQRPFVPSTSVTAGGVGLCMTDLLAYAKFHMGDGTSAKGERVLTRASLDQMRTVQAHKQGTDDDIGLAWHIRRVGPVHTYGHGGTLAAHVLLLEIVPERNFAIAILTNSETGWRLIQDVEREALKAYLGATYAPNQAIAHRGLVETLPWAEPLAQQPDPAPYLGTYIRPRSSYVVRTDGAKLVVEDRSNPNRTTVWPVAFFGPDHVVIIDGPDRGQSIEFVRDDGGRVNWIRIVRRVAVRSAAATGTVEARPSLNLRPCDVSGIPGGGRCGSLDVYENRSTMKGRRIALNVVVIPATGPAPFKEPVFWLEGGPGGAATGAIGPVAQQYLRGVRADRDLVFVDQRGTGKSNPLNCDVGESPSDLDRFFGVLFPLDLVRACRDTLERAADLTQYTTSIAADDLDDVREALGYPVIDLAGASYGTQAALVYMRRHRDRVRSAFLVGVAPPDFRLPLPFARAAQHALDETLADCAADPICHDAFPDVKREFDAVLARFDRGPLHVTMTDPASGRPRDVALTRESYVEHLRLQLYNTFGARTLPAVVHQAFLGNFLPFQRVASRNLPSGARGMYFSVTCSEDTPFISETDIVEQTRGTFLGDRRVRAHIAACAEWPRARVPRTFIDPVASDVPTIVYSGAADGSTPPWIAEGAVRFLSNGRLIRVAHTGHQIAGPCAWDLMRDFINRPVPGELDASCVAAAKRPPFLTEVPQ